MRIEDIIGMGKEYLGYGLVVAAGIAVIGCVVYGIQRKCNVEGQKRLSILTIAAWCALGAYMTVVIGATCLSRYQVPEALTVRPLFYAYREAWNRFSFVLWRNILLNFAMFVPLGFLLPFCNKLFKKWYAVYGTGLLVTLIIEFVQWRSKIGVFESDDILGNTVGTMIGFGAYQLCMLVINRCIRKKETPTVLRALLAQVPLLVALCAFSAIFIAYNTQELGNLPYSYVQKVNAKKLDVTCSFEPSGEAQELKVFAVKNYTYEEIRALADSVFAGVDAKFTREQDTFNDETAFFWGKDSDGNRYNITAYYKGGMYQLSDFRFTLWRMDSYVSVGGDADDSATPEGGSQMPKGVTDASEAQIREVLERYGVFPPGGGQFKNLGFGFYAFLYDFQPEAEQFPFGELQVSYYENGLFENIGYMLRQCRMVDHPFEAISEEEALQRLREGKFYWWQPIPEGGLNIVVDSVEIVYDLDTKGFYQPLYRFRGTINGENASIDIPALS